MGVYQGLQAKASAVAVVNWLKTMLKLFGIEMAESNREGHVTVRDLGS